MGLELSRVMRLEVPLIVVLGERAMRLSDVVALVPGAIIELPKKADEELELRVNNKPIAAGVAVKVGENFGLRIAFVGDLRERILAMAAESAAAQTAKKDAGTEAVDADALAEALLAGQTG